MQANFSCASFGHFHRRTMTLAVRATHSISVTMPGLFRIEDMRALKTPKLPKWVTRIVSYSGGAGLFVIAFLDSSVLSFPFVTDLLYVELVIQRPSWLIYYTAIATVGSLSGCIWLYILSKKGGEAYRKRHGGKQPGRIQKMVNEYAMLSVILPAVLPPPMPFKAFVIAEGVAQVPLRTFAVGILVGRGIRYLAEGILAVKYGKAAESFMMENKALAIITPVVLIGAIYLLTRWLLRPSSE